MRARSEARTCMSQRQTTLYRGGHVYSPADPTATAMVAVMLIRGGALTSSVHAAKAHLNGNRMTASPGARHSASHSMSFAPMRPGS